MSDTLNFILIIGVIVITIAIGYEIDNIRLRRKILQAQLDRMKNDE